MRTPGYGITLDRFMRVAHLLPRQRGNVAVDNYRFVNALLWMCRTGAPWRDLPECYGKWITVCRRFNRWSGNGAMERLFTALQEERIIGVEIRVLAMDSTSVKVHQHAVVPPKRNRTGPWDYDRQAYKGRNMVERVFQPHEAPPQGRHPLRQARRHLPRQPPAHPHRHPTQKRQQNQLA